MKLLVLVILIWNSCNLLVQAYDIENKIEIQGVTGVLLGLENVFD
jgi:hypothetical protein